ncbi:MULTISPECIES: preprotein translocase subunit SecE [Corynebacterium]|uniref:Protein translocase subunit SecE n=1 Tax=Corynebacterium provencense TaxID=1737425 RepID=A0A2Z3YMI8_9CORY|nr:MULTISPECIES: preprotein translocase subunit SecE [Corynebacterium]AWT25372.1 Protein translocase subunit SecE [Corynebacterium provencense]MCI1256242.1 preprotein translocase subunit SecE [Corynebacterium provencense]
MSDENTTNTRLRPAGKRQITGAEQGRTDRVASSRATDDADARGSRGPVAYVSSVGREMKKVIWPTGREMVSSVIITVIFLVIMVALCASVDFLTHEGVEFIFGF